MRFPFTLAIVAALALTAANAEANDLATANTAVGITSAANAALTNAEKAEVGVMVYADCVRLTADGSGAIVTRNASGALRVFTHHKCAAPPDPLVAVADANLAAASAKLAAAEKATADANAARVTAEAEAALAQDAATKAATEVATLNSRLAVETARADAATADATAKASALVMAEGHLAQLQADADALANAPLCGTDGTQTVTRVLSVAADGAAYCQPVEVSPICTSLIPQGKPADEKKGVVKQDPPPTKVHRAPPAAPAKAPCQKSGGWYDDGAPAPKNVCAK